jgi:hypothetical protein
MNMHGLVSQYVGAVNPLLPVTVQISTGPGAQNPDGSQTPSFATPGAITASVSGDVLTVTNIASGVLQAGQTLADAGALLPATTITSQLTGTTGGLGTYLLSQIQPAPIASEAMTTALNLIGQVQPISTPDLKQLEGINLGGVHWKIYLSGEVDAIVRPERKGGDLVTIGSGRHQGVWLVVGVLEQWPDWCVAGIVLQNDAIITTPVAPFSPSLDFSDPRNSQFLPGLT